MKEVSGLSAFNNVIELILIYTKRSKSKTPLFLHLLEYQGLTLEVF